MNSVIPAAKNASTGIDFAPYRQAINQVVATKRYIDYRSAYEEAVVQYLNSIRAAHKIKRNFIKLVDQTKWAKRSSLPALQEACGENGSIQRQHL